MYDRRIAQKCLAMIQSDYEQYQQGLAPFRIEKYTGRGWTDVLEYYREWMNEVIEPKRKPATIKGYWSYFRTWFMPFFTEHPIMLHEIQLDTLNKMLNYINLSPKGKYNTMNAFHSFLDYAWRAKRIPEMPAFPKKEDYNLTDPIIKWIPESRQMAIINAIPEQDRPIFLWLKYHVRRPSEACALKWGDYDEINQSWIIRRTLSARQLVDSTKTRAIHVIPCHSDFIPVIKKIRQDSLNGFVFVNRRSRFKDKRYTLESLNVLWKAACEKTGECIDLYSGLKHSTCSQMINERGLTLNQVQLVTDHANIESVKKYAKVELDIKRRLMESPVCPPDTGKIKKLYE
jgi:integrase